MKKGKVEDAQECKRGKQQRLLIAGGEKGGDDPGGAVGGYKDGLRNEGGESGERSKE